jgi:antitoxin (DNA-binding transcriptional repressor) of toxin-antitoxin stability system
MLNWLKMKTISVRELRQKWPEAERALKIESEIVITRDGKPGKIDALRGATEKTPPV